MLKVCIQGFSRAKSLVFYTDSNVDLYSHVKYIFNPMTVINIDSIERVNFSIAGVGAIACLLWNILLL